MRICVYVFMDIDVYIFVHAHMYMFMFMYFAMYLFPKQRSGIEVGFLLVFYVISPEYQDFEVSAHLPRLA